MRRVKWFKVLYYWTIACGVLAQIDGVFAFLGAFGGRSLESVLVAEIGAAIGLIGGSFVVLRCISMRMEFVSETQSSAVFNHDTTASSER